MKNIKSYASVIFKALLLNLPIIGLIISRFLSDVVISLQNTSYIVFMIFGYYFLVSFIIVIPALLVSFFKRISLFIAWLSLSLFLYYLLLDSIVYGVYKFHINLFFIELFFIDFENFGFTTGILTLAIGALFVIFIIEYMIFKFANRISNKYLFLIIPVVFMFVLSQMIHIFAFENDRNDITSISPRMPLYFPITSSSLAKKHNGFGENLGLGSEFSQRTKDNLSIKYPKKQDLWRGKIKKEHLPNIIFIVLESWRFDMIDSIISPNIYDLSLKSTYAKNHISTGNSTTSGIFGMFYGLHPTYWEAIKANSKSIDNPVLIDVLKENSYNFGLFTHSNFTRFKLTSTIFNGLTLTENFQGKEDWLKDSDMNNRMIQFIKSNKKQENPFFGFIFYTSTHHAYSFPKSQELFKPSGKINMGLVSNQTDPKPYLNAYKNSIHFVDSLVQNLLVTLEKNDLDSNTIIVLTSDHGEEFNDNKENYWGHGSNFTKYQTSVPMIMYFPKKEPVLVSKVTSHIDIVPTLMQEAFNIKDSTQLYSNGKNIYNLETSTRPLVSASYVNHALIIGENVYTVYPFSLKKYNILDTKKKISNTNQKLFRKAIDEMNWFFK